MFTKPFNSTRITLRRTFSWEISISKKRIRPLPWPSFRSICALPPKGRTRQPSKRSLPRFRRPWALLKAESAPKRHPKVISCRLITLIVAEKFGQDCDALSEQELRCHEHLC